MQGPLRNGWKWSLCYQVEAAKPTRTGAARNGINSYCIIGRGFIRILAGPHHAYVATPFKPPDADRLFPWVLGNVRALDHVLEALDHPPAGR